MFVQQLYTSCLAEAAYYIESDGEAAIIDPLRETQPYLELAAGRKAKIKYVFETHFHADFVSGHIDLAKRTGATIVYGPDAHTGYASYAAKDGEEFRIGSIRLKVLHTPGHTLESSCYLLLDEKNQPQAVFTGDTLFVGDVGRPDLAVKSELTVNDLAGMMYDSLNNKIKVLPDHVTVYPAHGAGSACGKNIGKETYSTIGQQKQYNYALQPMSKEAFVAAVTDGLAEAPAYFAMDAMLNKNGYRDIEEVIHNNKKALDPAAFEKEKEKGCVVLDTRDPEQFEKAFVPGSINIGLNGQYAPWVGALIDTKANLILVTDEHKEAEALLRLARVGYEKVSGYLQGGMAAWIAAGKVTDSIKSISAGDFVQQHNNGDKVIDVRNAGEWNNGIIEGAMLSTLSKFEKELNLLNKDEHYYIHCAGGYRSMIAASLAHKNGFTRVTNVLGGINQIKQEGKQLVVPETAI